MQSIPSTDLEAIRSWAASVPVVSRVWIFGSRARGTQRTDSDLDIAVEHGAMSGDSDAFTTSMSELENWRAQLQPLLSIRIDLQSQIPGLTHTIQSGLDESSVLIYQRET